MKRIAIICPHPEGVAPGQRLKYEQYFSHWRENGWQVHVYPFQTMRFWNVAQKKSALIEKIFWTLYGYFQRILLLFKLRNYDITYTFLWVTPFGPPLFEFLYSLISKKLVYDIDDLVYMGKASDSNSWISRLKGKNKPIYLMKKADHIVTCTPYLDNFVRQYNQNTTDISSTIQTDKYQIVDSDRENNKKVIIGWSGSHSTAKYLYLLKDVLLNLNQQIPFKLVVMGTDSFKVEGLDIDCFKWSKEIEISTIQNFDIGVYPLPDEQWVHGKSGLKALQYMACGVPTVASNIGEAITRVIDNEENGFLVNTDQEWLEKLMFLIKNTNERKQMGLKARDKVVKQYSIEANKDAYLNILNQVSNQ